ncbi:pyridoxal phosphate-dependent aminotransferase [Paracoccus sp. PS-1]|uniref:MalY/PatB family protein n=1 Tax=unclassified Paracoccus (in: a-proteobacteria) TaxID=2688777 RepID=UPI0004913157|nr:MULTISPECIES: MalY/PatB family protein [unclassified Paracoccus (in: a-proteobacteria)]MDQ7262851.1 pyridoxal phosphate-dependent aminotransferase [Paracoccus sp. PS1]
MAQPDFDEIIDRTGTACSKWDDMQAIYGVSPQDGIAMWVADMDFRPPASVQRAVEAMAAHGVYGYPGANPAYVEAIRWWMETRHGWQVQPEWILSAHGLVNGTAVCVDAFTRPGDRVIIMTPVYHAFARVIRASGREVAEFPLAMHDGQYRMDWEGWQKLLTGRERMLILCSPHNPGGRVWSAEELRQVADFCAAHDLILVSDEIHHDLVLPGGPRHSVLATVAPEAAPRLVTLTAATKTFNIAGAHIGNLIVADERLRKRLQTRLMALGISPGLFGPGMVAAAYSPEGAAWVDALTGYLDGNRRLFDDGVNAIPGLRSMPLQATYLAWVDFSDTGMERAEFTRRVEQGARIAANHGGSFGTGGEDFLRFNLATPRARVAEAVARLQEAFRDLQ